MPNTGPSLDTGVMVVTNYSEHKLSAFRVLVEYLSTENQISIASTMASGPAVIEEEVIEQFGSELEQYEERNTSIFFKQEPAVAETFSHLDRYVTIDLDEFIEMEMDIPTFLRVTEEQAEAAIIDAEGAR